MPSKVIVKEVARMGETETRKAWLKENTVRFSMKLQKSTDADILQYLEGKNVQGEIKRGLRLLIANNKKTEEG
jgi:hypothetical protein